MKLKLALTVSTLCVLYQLSKKEGSSDEDFSKKPCRQLKCPSFAFKSSITTTFVDLFPSFKFTMPTKNWPQCKDCNSAQPIEFPLLSMISLNY